MGILREEHGGLYVTEGSGRDGGVNRRALAAAAGLCVVIVAWALVNLFVEGMGFPVIDSEKVRGGEEAASALARLFGALVLGLFLHLVIKKFWLDDKYLHIRSYHLQGSRYRLTVGARFVGHQNAGHAFTTCLSSPESPGGIPPKRLLFRVVGIVYFQHHTGGPFHSRPSPPIHPP